MHEDDLIKDEEKIEFFVKIISKKVDENLLGALTSGGGHSKDKIGEITIIFEEYFHKIFQIIPLYKKIDRFQVFYLGRFHAICPSFQILELFQHVNNINNLVQEDLIDKDTHIDFLLKILNRKIQDSQTQDTKLNIPLDSQLQKEKLSQISSLSERMCSKGVELQPKEVFHSSKSSQLEKFSLIKDITKANLYDARERGDSPVLNVTKIDKAQILEKEVENDQEDREIIINKNEIGLYLKKFREEYDLESIEQGGNEIKNSSKKLRKIKSRKMMPFLLYGKEEWKQKQGDKQQHKDKFFTKSSLDLWRPKESREIDEGVKYREYFLIESNENSKSNQSTSLGSKDSRGKLETDEVVPVNIFSFGGFDTRHTNQLNQNSLFEETMVKKEQVHLENQTNEKSSSKIQDLLKRTKESTFKAFQNTLKGNSFSKSTHFNQKLEPEENTKDNQVSASLEKPLIIEWKNRRVSHAMEEEIEPIYSSDYQTEKQESSSEEDDDDEDQNNRSIELGKRNNIKHQKLNRKKVKTETLQVINNNNNLKIKLEIEEEQSYSQLGLIRDINTHPNPTPVFCSPLLSEEGE